MSSSIDDDDTQSVHPFINPRPFFFDNDVFGVLRPSDPSCMFQGCFKDVSRMFQRLFQG